MIIKFQIRYYKYFAISEKYTSQFYIIEIPVLKNLNSDELTGYYNSAKIISENEAQTQVEIPGMVGRDLLDYSFYTKKKKEYVEAGGTLYLSEDAITKLSVKPTFTIKIANDGYAKWYKVNNKKAGNKIIIQTKKKGAFVVYDGKDKFVSNSYIDGKKTVKLPKNGYIVFIGNKGTTFTVTYK